MDILKELQKHFDLSENEIVIATYMIEHSEEIPKLSSREFAKRTYTSATSIIRFIKKLGYSNYNEFKYNIGNVLKNLSINNYAINLGEDNISLINKTAQLEINAINQMKDMLSITTLNKIIELLETTNYLDIIANDTNAMIAKYAAHCFSNVGKIVTVYHEIDKQLNFTFSVSNDHLVIILSKFSLNTYLLEMALTLKRRRITSVAITSNHNNKLSDYCSYTIHTPFDEKMDRIGELVYFTACKYIFDLIYSILVARNFDKSKKIKSLYDQIFLKKL